MDRPGLVNLYNNNELKIIVQVMFKDPWFPEVGDDSDNAHEFRLYNDGTWEFLDENEAPIFQGMHAELKRERNEKP